MPVIAVNVVKVLFAISLYGFLFYVARAMRGHVAGPPVDANPTPAPAARRTRAEDSPPPAPRRATLEITTPSGKSQTVPVSRRVVLGRGSSADVVIDDEYSSDRHAAFEMEGDTVWVEDLGSTNGTHIGDTRITDRTRVASGTEVLVGRTRVVVR